MILVTLGTQDKGFERLLKQIEKEIINGNIKEKVVVQAGHTKYESSHMEIFDLVSPDEFEKLMKEARILITHGGAGSILSGIKNGKIVIAAARLKKYKEHNNDHQKQIIREFTDKGYILELRDFSKLSKVLEKTKTFKPKKFVSNTKNMVKLVENYIEDDNHISWYNKMQEIISYCFFGFLTTVINILCFYLLDKVGLTTYVNNLISWIVSVIFAFITNKLFVFKSKGFKIKTILRESLSFFILRVLSLGIDMGFLYLLFDVLNLSKMLSKIIVNIIVIIVNYIFSKLFVFKENK